MLGKIRGWFVLINVVSDWNDDGMMRGKTRVCVLEINFGSIGLLKLEGCVLKFIKLKGCVGNNNETRFDGRKFV